MGVLSVDLLTNSFWLVALVVKTSPPQASTPVKAPSDHEHGPEKQKRELMSYQKIFDAVRDRKTDLVMSLIDDDETLLNITDSNMSTPLTRAFAYKGLELARLLIERGAASRRDGAAHGRASR